MQKTCYLIVLSQLIFGTVKAQEFVKARPSPVAIVSLRFKDAYVKITYCQPRKNGREVFGKLVPFGQVWRTGANEATEITLTKDLEINGQLLKAGTYSIFTIPENEKWTVIFNSDLGLWGAYNYNPKMDVMRFEITVHTRDVISESFTISFDQRNDVADLLIQWDRTGISIPIKFIN